jgi:hypothetical protein
LVDAQWTSRHFDVDELASQAGGEASTRRRRAAGSVVHWELLLRGIRNLSVVFLAMIASLGLALFPTKGEAAQEQTASLSGEVAAGEHHVTRLRNLPQGANLEVVVQTDGSLRVMVVDDDQFASLPGTVDPVFSGSGDSQIRFQLTIPASGTYYLVIDNSEASETRNFSMRVQASVEEARSGGEGDDESRALAELERFQSNLRQTFIFDELEFRIDACGEPGASTRGDTVTLCLEVGPLAVQRLDDAAKARDVVLFVMLREVGRALLQQWDFPAAESEDTVDQFAVVLYLMYGQTERLNSVVDFLGAPGDGGDSGQIDTRPERLENLKKWIDDPGLVQRWQPFLVPHIQTSTLRVLASHPRGWTDVELIKKELARR